MSILVVAANRNLMSVQNHINSISIRYVCSNSHTRNQSHHDGSEISKMTHALLYCAEPLLLLHDELEYDARHYFVARILVGVILSQ